MQSTRTACTHSLPFTPSTARDALSAFAAAARNMQPSSRALWRSRLSHIYGNMDGQRAVALDKIATILQLPNTDSWRVDLLIAMETYFALICDVIALSSLTKSPSRYFQDISSLSTLQFTRQIVSILSGTIYEDFGVYGATSSFEYSWPQDALTSSQARQIQGTIGSLSSAWHTNSTFLRTPDPLQHLHASLFPKNLLHITGQFYTPFWLADLLLSDLAWSPDQTLIDPFCGSGIFLLAALERANKLHIPAHQTLNMLCGIDLNPTACVAARSNIVLHCARTQEIGTHPLYLNILGADSIAPSIVKGKSQDGQSSFLSQAITVDGESVDLPDFHNPSIQEAIHSALAQYGMPLTNWVKQPRRPKHHRNSDSSAGTARDRRIWEQLAVFCLRPADTLATNPPWVGWEYISRPYRETIKPAWGAYGLFKARGLDAAFLKEDLSTLALLSAWDLYLKDRGESVVVIRPAVMRSGLAGRGLRRLSVFDNHTPLQTQIIREFPNVRVFQDALTDTASWKLRKGLSTEFPIDVVRWDRRAGRPNPNADHLLSEVRSLVTESKNVASRTDPKDHGSRWITTHRDTLTKFSFVQGTNSYVPRMGVFTGGANAVFYLRPVAEASISSTMTYQNVTERAKRRVSKRTVEIEKSIVFPVLRGRDIQMWHYAINSYILCPHTPVTKMYPLSQDHLRSQYPLAHEYLTSMKPTLRERRGFGSWEKGILERHFYTLQRIGEYTFLPYKVCWKYVARSFTVCVLATLPEEQPILPNDKVMFVAFTDRDAAYFLGGLLSSKIIRSYVDSCSISRQISASILQSLSLPLFDNQNQHHRRVSSICRDGHEALANNDHVRVEDARAALDEAVDDLYGIADTKSY